RSGQERDFTLDPAAHNVPVIGGVAQQRRDAAVEQVGPAEAVVDLAGCYPIDGLAARRTVRLSGRTVLVSDEIGGVDAGTEVLTHWLVPGELSWRFLDGWARLSDGSGAAVWLGRAGGAVGPEQLARHPGSRGPLTLTVPTTPG